MKSSINRLILVIYILENLTTHVADSTVQIQVPEVSYLNEPTTLNCSTSQAFSTIIYRAPSGNSPQCPQTGCTPVSGFKADIINSTYTQLTILRVQQRHAGQWGCADGDNNFNYSPLVVAERTAKIQVPEVSYLNETTILNCSTSQAFSTIIYKAPSGNVPNCSQTGCTPVSGFEAKRINSTSTQLKILRVQKRHAGQWGCADGGNNFNYKSLFVSERPPRTECPLPPDNSQQIIIAAVVAVLLTSLLWVIVFKREELRDVIGRMCQTDDAKEKTKQPHSRVSTVNS